MRIAVAMLALAAPIRLNAGLNAGLLAGAVSVEIFENLPKGAEFDLGKASATDRYYEPAFGFVRTPTKFAANAVPLDRSMPFVLRARFERTLPAGKYRFRLRSRGAAQFAIDGKTVASTKAQKPNTSGDDPVPPAIDKSDSPLRPAMYPHQDAPLDVELNAGPHSFEMIAIIGGKGLMPTPGELLVSFGNGAELERLLGPDGTPP